MVRSQVSFYVFLMLYLTQSKLVMYITVFRFP